MTKEEFIEKWNRYNTDIKETVQDDFDMMNDLTNVIHTCKLTQITININENTLNNINELSMFFDQKNKTKVISTCITITKELVNYINEGKKIYIEDKHYKHELKII
jgi:citrate synthase